MKIKFYLSLAVAALVMTNCSQEEIVQKSQGSKAIIATVENASRSAVTDAGVFSWTSGDAISVLGEGENKRDTYTYSGEGDNFTEPIETTVTEPVVAYYPASADHTTTHFYLASHYDVLS